MKLYCKGLAEAIKRDCRERLAKLPTKPYLLIIQVAGDAASDAYTKGKKKDCAEIGLRCIHELLPNNATESDVLEVIERGNLDETCIGIILQLPLPKHLQFSQDLLLRRIYRSKDVDGFVSSLYEPCTPAGIIQIIKSWYDFEDYKDLSNRTVLVIGRGKLVGAPLYKLLNKENATIIQANSHTEKATLKYLCNVSDIIVTATGKPGTLTKYHINGNFSGLIIDAGIARGTDGKLCGDVDEELYEMTNVFVTPVPGGVGLMTRAMLLKNCVDAACKKWGN